MIGSPKQFADQYLEMISLMSKRWVQTEWPTLIPELISYLNQSQDPNIIRYSLEAMRKICKKYRYMFRSDALYSEMNYIIENLSVHLLTQANNCIQAAKANSGD
jgi:exportin-2 (importin alpha re-exporter)